MLSLPAGGRGLVLPDGLVAEAMGRLPHWIRIGGIADGLLVDEREPGDLVRPSLEDGLLSVWTEPFAWLLLAEPVPVGEVASLADELADRQQRAQSMAEMSPEESVTATRLEPRHRELRLATTSGLWRVHLLAGGASPQGPSQRGT